LHAIFDLNIFYCLEKAGAVMRGKIQKIGGRGRDSGYSLMELVIVLVVTGFLVVSITPFFRISIRSYMGTRLGKETLEASRIAFNRMISELKRIQTLNEIYYGSSTRIEFQYPDENGDEQYTIYDYSSGNRWIIEGVTSFRITYYKSDGNSFTPYYNTENIWRIKVEMTVGSKDYVGAEYKLVQEIHPKAIGLD